MEEPVDSYNVYGQLILTSMDMCLGALDLLLDPMEV